MKVTAPAVARNTGVFAPKPNQPAPKLEVAARAEPDDAFEPAPAKPQVDRSATWNQPGGELTPDDLQRVGAGFDKTKAPQALWSDAAVPVQVSRGREQGGLDEEQSARNAELARGASEQLGDSAVGAADLLVLARDAGVPLERQDAQQLTAASNYVNRAENVEQREQRLKAALDTLSILDTAGAPKLQDVEFRELLWDAAKIPGHAIDALPQARRDQIMQDIAGATNTPGEHQLKVEKYNTTLKVGDGNEVLSSSTKKPSPWKTIAKIALNVGLGVAAAVTGGAALVVVKAVQIGMSVYQGVKSAAKGDWLGAVSGFAGAFGGVSRAVSGATSTSTRVAQTVTASARVAGGAVDAVKNHSVSGLIGAAAQGFCVASSVSSNVKLDQLTTVAGHAATGARVAEAAVRHDVGALASAGLSLASGATHDAGTQNLLRKLGGVTQAACAGARGDWASAAEAGTALAAQLTGSGRLEEASRLLSGVQAVRTAGQRGDWAMASQELEALGHAAREAFTPELKPLKVRDLMPNMATSAMSAVTGTSLAPPLLEGRRIGNGMAETPMPVLRGTSLAAPKAPPAMPKKQQPVRLTDSATVSVNLLPGIKQESLAKVDAELKRVQTVIAEGGRGWAPYDAATRYQAALQLSRQEIVDAKNEHWVEAAFYRLKSTGENLSTFTEIEKQQRKDLREVGKLWLHGAAMSVAVTAAAPVAVGASVVNAVGTGVLSDGTLKDRAIEGGLQLGMDALGYGAAKLAAPVARYAGRVVANALWGADETAALAARAGEAEVPWLIRQGEGTLPASARTASVTRPMKLDPQVSREYLYVVNKDGSLTYAPQVRDAANQELLKHTDLTRLNEARISGVIRYDPASGVWHMDAESGRYSIKKLEGAFRTRENLEAAVEIARRSGTRNIVMATPESWTLAR